MGTTRKEARERTEENELVNCGIEKTRLNMESEVEPKKGRGADPRTIASRT